MSSSSAPAPSMPQRATASAGHRDGGGPLDRLGGDPEPVIAARSVWKIVRDVACFGLLLAVAVGTVAGQRFENDVLAAATVPLPWPIDRVARMVIFSVIPLGSITLWSAFRRRREAAARQALALVVIAITAAELLKHVVILRPDLVGAPRYWLKPSFPSGHMTTALVIGATAVLLAPRSGRSIVSVMAWLYSSAMAASLIVTHNHRLSDIIASCLVVRVVGEIVGPRRRVKRSVLLASSVPGVIGLLMLAVDGAGEAASHWSLAGAALVASAAAATVPLGAQRGATDPESRFS